MFVCYNLNLNGTPTKILNSKEKKRKTREENGGKTTFVRMKSQKVETPQNLRGKNHAQNLKEN